MVSGAVGQERSRAVRVERPVRVPHPILGGERSNPHGHASHSALCTFGHERQLAQYECSPRAEVLPKSHRAWRAGNYLIVTSLGCAFGCGQRRTRRPPRRDYSMPRIITPCRSIGRWKRRANSRSVSSAE